MSQIARYLLVGLFNTAFGYCIIFFCMYSLDWSAVASNIAGYAIGLSVSYLLNRDFTFKSSTGNHNEFLRFLLVFAIAYFSNLAALVLFIKYLNLHEGLSQIIAGAIYITISYLLNKLWVFKPAQ